MNYTLKYYNYSQCFTHYTDRIMSIRQAKIRGEVIVAKPVLMLALIDGIDSGVFTNNRFWVLLQSKEWRTRLRDYIVEHKLTDVHWLRNLTEGLASLIAILMVA